MLNTQSTLEDIRRTINKCDGLYNEVLHNKGLRGKRERAMLRGQEWVHQYVKMGDQPVLIFCHVPSRTWMPVINIEGTYILNNIDKNHKRFLTFLRRHALERYVQRLVKHNEKAEVSDEEMENAMLHIIEQMMFTTSTYDPGTNAWIMNVDGGAFICSKWEEKQLMIMQTYITVSKMKLNQSIANGSSSRASRARRHAITPATIREFAKKSTLADWLNVELDEMF